MSFVNVHLSLHPAVPWTLHVVLCCPSPAKAPFRRNFINKPKAAENTQKTKNGLVPKRKRRPRMLA